MNGVSVIICCYNAAKRINPTLNHLQQQLFTEPLNWEVIIIDNASTDQTADIAKQVWADKPVTNFIVKREEKPGLMHARKRGLSEARYDIVSFIDDDNWVESSWVQKVFNVFSMNEKIGACGGRSEAVFEGEKPGWFDDYQNSFAVGTQAKETGIVDDKKGFLWGAGLSFRKSLWSELEKKGFKNLTFGREGKNINAGEDSELCYAFRLMGYNLYYCNDLSLKHFIPSNRMNINYLARMYEGFGKAYARLNCYKVLLEESFKVYPWWYEWVSAKRKILFFSVLQRFVFNKNKKIKLITDKAYLKGYAEVVWIDKNSIEGNIQTLRKLFD